MSLSVTTLPRTLNSSVYFPAALAARGVPAWYLDKLIKPADITTEQYLGGLFDWRREPQNWHATYLDQLSRAGGIIVVLSESAAESRKQIGRGMWRERAAIEFFLADNPLRVREIIRTSETPSDAMVSELATWGRQVLSLPSVLRKDIDNPNAFNEPTGLGRGIPLQLPEGKSKATEWYELVRRDLYDVQWHCRRCGLQSDTYVMAQENPPAECPRCGFESMPCPDEAEAVQLGEELSDKEREFLAKVPDFIAKLTARLTKQND